MRDTRTEAQRAFQHASNRQLRRPCRCNCHYSCGRKCGLPPFECARQHWVQDCNHKWDGPEESIEFMGCSGGSVTCSRCRTSCIAHDAVVGP